MSEEIGNEVVTAPRLELVAKLAEACDAVGGVEKKGTNEAQRYKYVKAADIAKAIRHELFSRGIVIIPDEQEPEYVTINLPPDRDGKPRSMTECRLATIFNITNGPETLSMTAYGVARDSGDKAIYKAKTGALKYFLRGLGLIPDEKDDPEHDSDSGEGSASQETSLRGIGGIIKEQRMADNGAVYTIFDPATKRSITLQAPDEAMGSTRLIDQVGKYAGFKARPLTADKDCATFILHDVVNVRNENFMPDEENQVKKPTGVGSPKTISDAQRKRLWAIAKSKELSETHLRDLLGRYGYESTGEVQSKDYEKICADIDPTLAK